MSGAVDQHLMERWGAEPRRPPLIVHSMHAEPPPPAAPVAAGEHDGRGRIEVIHDISAENGILVRFVAPSGRTTSLRLATLLTGLSSVKQDVIEETCLSLLSE